MTNRKKYKTEAEKAAQRRRTACNKSKRIEKALLTAGGKQKSILEEKLEFYKNQF